MKESMPFEDNEWTFDRLKIADEEIAKIALEELKLDVYPNQIEIISSDQMLDAYASIGLPLMYNHWSFGKKFLQQEFSYRKGYSGLAYEIVINLNPSISYLMENNSMTMQTLVIAHAAYGHNSVFKNNYLFKQYTDADGMLDYLQFAKNYIAECEHKYGPDRVEATLDACHAIMDFSVDKYKRPTKLNKRQEREQQKEREAFVQSQANILWSTIPTHEKTPAAKKHDKFPAEPQENLMYFLEKNSPVLESWQREIVRIVRKIGQYYYPQRLTKTLNEGWASFTHYYIMNRLWEKGLLTNGQYLEFIHSHSGVLYQPTYDSKYYSGFNPYALGFDIFTDIKRMCENPTDEDREYFPHLMGQHWLDVCHDAVANYKDDSFIAQFMSPHLMRKWKLFELTNNENDEYVRVSSIQNREGYNNIRRALSNQYSVSNSIPDIQVVNANPKTTRLLELEYNAVDNKGLHKSHMEVLDHIEYLWGYEVELTTKNRNIPDDDDDEDTMNYFFTNY